MSPDVVRRELRNAARRRRLELLARVADRAHQAAPAPALTPRPQERLRR